MKEIAEGNRKQQLFLRAMTNGVLSERDRLYEYTIGEFYNEFSLFITECQEKERQMEEIKTKRR